MRKLIGCGILALSALVVSASSVWASPIPVGELTFTLQECDDPDDCVIGGMFSIVNQTGANQQPGVFPILDQVGFSTITLEIDGNPVTLTDVFGDGYNFDSDPSFGLLALIGGAAPAGPFTVQGGGGFIGGEYLFSGNFFTSPSPVNVGDINSDENESAIIYIEGRRVEDVVPEPVTLGLLGSGLVGLYLRRRSARRA